MRRTSTLNLFQDKATSLDNENTNLEAALASDQNLLDSDSESFTEGTKRISKKRNTYQRIPDDIRVNLLESVKNGETLKAAAKRYKINYSSAKSILHTFRKEGRILKKSAQERTQKKKRNGQDSKFQDDDKGSPLSEEVYMKPVLPLSERTQSLANTVSTEDSHSESSGNDEKNYIGSTTETGTFEETPNQQQTYSNVWMMDQAANEDTQGLQTQGNFQSEVFDASFFEQGVDQMLATDKYPSSTNYFSTNDFFDISSNFPNKSYIKEHNDFPFGTYTFDQEQHCSYHEEDKFLRLEGNDDKNGDAMLNFPFQGFLEPQAFFQENTTREHNEDIKGLFSFF